METNETMTNNEVVEQALDTIVNTKLDLTPGEKASVRLLDSFLIIGAGACIIGAGVGIYKFGKFIKRKIADKKEVDVEVLDGETNESWEPIVEDSEEA